jgi:hypothetical protein
MPVPLYKPEITLIGNGGGGGAEGLHPYDLSVGCVGVDGHLIRGPTWRSVHIGPSSFLA